MGRIWKWRKRWRQWRVFRASRREAIEVLGGDSWARYKIDGLIGIWRRDGFGVIVELSRTVAEVRLDQEASETVNRIHGTFGGRYG